MLDGELGRQFLAALGQAIGGRLFALFLRSGVYREYAERYMPKELVDEVDIQAYLGSVPGSAPAAPPSSS